MSRTFQEIWSYSPQFDCMTARISMTDDNRQEFFMLVPETDPTRSAGAKARGGLRRALRNAALDAIQEAIEAGLVPGEVRVTPADWRDMVTEQFAERAA